MTKPKPSEAFEALLNQRFVRTWTPLNGAHCLAAKIWAPSERKHNESWVCSEAGVSAVGLLGHWQHPHSVRQNSRGVRGNRRSCDVFAGFVHPTAVIQRSAKPQERDSFSVTHSFSSEQVSTATPAVAGVLAAMLAGSSICAVLLSQQACRRFVPDVLRCTTSSLPNKAALLLLLISRCKETQRNM